MKEAAQILKNIRLGQYATIYFLHGEEPYYIDLISDEIEQKALPEAAKGFNQIVMYGKDVRMNDILDNARRFPMMSARQVVIVKEAQNIADLGKDEGDQKLIQYLANPQPSTILVFCYKHKTLDKRKSIYKALEKHAVILTSTKLYDNQLPDWIRAYVKDKGHGITDKAVFMLVEYIGNNLERLSNEIDKLMINVPDDTEINDHLIQKYVGISKEYNAFELQKAVAVKDVLKANKIVKYFEANPKNNPVIPIFAILYNYFSRLLIVHQTPDKSEQSLAAALKTNRFFIKDYLTGAKNYPLPRVIKIIHDIRAADLQSKGVNASNLPEGQILKELVFKILY